MKGVEQRGNVRKVEATSTLLLEKDWTFMSDRNILFLMIDMLRVRKGQMALNKKLFLDEEYFKLHSKKHRLNRKKVIYSNHAVQINFYVL